MIYFYTIEKIGEINGKMVNKMGAARKKPLTTKQYRDIEKMVAEGITRESIAKSLGWSVPTFYRYLDKDDRLKEVVDSGKNTDYQVMCNMSREKALAGSFQHFAAYMRLIHGVNITDGTTTGSNGVSINVHLNLGQDQQGELIEQAPEQLPQH